MRLSKVAEGHVTLINRYMSQHYGLAPAEHKRLKEQWRELWTDAMNGPNADAFVQGLLEAGVTREEMVAFASGQEV